MSDWITDRPPTEEDAGPAGLVWTTYNGKTSPWSYDGVVEGTPWMRMIVPEPYVNPKRYVIRCYADFGVLGLAGYWCVYDIVRNVSVSDFMPLEAAERIAATYEEVMP